VPPTPPPNEQAEARENRKEAREADNLWLQKLTAFLVFAYATVALFQWCEMRKATKATQDIINATEEHFRVDERAWVEIEPIKPVLLTASGPDTGAVFTCDIYPKNFGKTVATDISVKATDVFTSDGFDENRGVVDRTQDTCQDFC
jgi:hypothetical protein